MEKEDKIINEKDVIVDNSSAETAGNEPQGERPVNDSKTWFIRHKKLVGLFVILLIIGLSIGIAAIIDGARGIQVLGDFVSDQILGFKWLNTLLGMAFTGMFGAAFMATHWGSAIQFFIYDTIKIIVLLCSLIFIISYIQSYFPPERTKKILKHFKGIGGNTMGALLGTVTPFCSCSSIPLFMGFTRAGLSSGVTFSFLISSPLVDLGAFILLASVFGFPIAIAYVVVGLILAIIGGTIIEKTGVGNHVREFVLEGSIPEIEAL
jgi:uncharacterized protein